MDDDTIQRLADEAFGITTGGGMTPSVALSAFARACYAEGQRDAQARIAELERENNEQARLLGISGSTEARLLARVAELEQQLHIEYKRGLKVGKEVAERDQLLCPARIRAVIGDADGRMTQDEVVDCIAAMRKEGGE